LLLRHTSAAHPKEAHHEPTLPLAPNTAVPPSAARRCVGARMAGGHGSRALQPGWGWRRPCDRLAGRGSRRRQRRTIHRCDRWRSVDQVPIVKRTASPFLPDRRTKMNDNSQTGQNRQALEAAHGNVWTEEEIAQEFRITAIIAPQVVVVRRSDGQVGSLTFQNDPRFYFNFQPSAGFDHD
jgi:hypothetical protein